MEALGGHFHVKFPVIFHSKFHVKGLGKTMVGNLKGRASHWPNFTQNFSPGWPFRAFVVKWPNKLACSRCVSAQVFSFIQQKDIMA